MKGRFGSVLLVAGSLACFHACGGDDESSAEPTRGSENNNKPVEPTCPDERPEGGAVCSNRGLMCEYDEGDCLCDTDSNGTFGATAWECGRNFSPMLCPEAEPEPGSMCMNVFMECDYSDTRRCSCSFQDDTWACWNPMDCPATPPANMSACDPVGMECEYEDTMTDCDCLPEGWDCEMDPF